MANHLEIVNGNGIGLTLFPMAGGRCVSRQFKIDSIQAGMKFSGLQLNDNSFLSIL